MIGLNFRIAPLQVLKFKLVFLIDNGYQVISNFWVQEYVKCVPGLKDSVLWYSDLGTLFQISLDSGLGLLDSPEKIKRLGTF